MEGGHRHSRRRSSLPVASSSTSSSGSASRASRLRLEPIPVRAIPAPLRTPPGSCGLALPPSENVEMVSRPPTPAPSPTLDASCSGMHLDSGEANGLDGHLGSGDDGDSPTEVLNAKGKARLRDGEVVGPDLRMDGVFDDDDPQKLFLRFQRLDRSQRKAFLSAMVGDLELDEAVTISRRIEPRLRRDFLRELPLELALHAMSFIDEARTLGRAAQVSRHWNHLFSDEQTWKEIYDRHRGMSHTGFVPPSTSPFLLYGAHLRDSQSSSSSLSSSSGETEGRMPPDEVRKRNAMSALGSGTTGFTNALGRRPFAERSRSGTFKQQFKNAYITESNWLHGGHVLANHIPAEEGPVTTLAMDERHIAIGMANSRIHVFDIATGRLKKHLLGHVMGVWALALVSKNPMGEASFKSTPRANGESRSASSLGVSEDASQARRSSFNTSAPSRAEFGILPGMGFVDSPKRPSTATGFEQSLPQKEAVKLQPSDVCGSSTGWPGLRRDLAVSGGSDKSLKVWDIETGKCLHTLLGHRSTLRCLKMLEGRPICVTGSRDTTVKVWDIEKGRMIHDLRGHTSPVRCLEVAGNQIVSGSYDHSCRLWDADTGECLQVLQGHFGQIYAVAFDGVRIVAGSADTTVRVWSAATGQCLALLQGHTSLVGQLQLTDDILTTGGSDGRIIVFNLATMQCLERLCAHDNSVTSLQFDQRFILSGGNDGRAKVWDMQTGRFLRELTVACEAVWRVAFKEDRAIVLCQRGGGTTALEIISFRPEDEKVRPRWNPNIARTR